MFIPQHSKQYCSPDSGLEGLASGELAVYLSDEEAGTIALREDAGSLRASFARLPNISHRCDAFVDARHPKHLRCVCRIGKMAVVAFKIVNRHSRSVGQAFRLRQRAHPQVSESLSL